MILKQIIGVAEREKNYSTNKEVPHLLYQSGK